MDRDDKGYDETIAAPPAADTPTIATVGHAGPAMPVSWPTSSAGETQHSSLTRYRLGEVIGRGGMGEVVSAHDEQIGRSVAIKRMRGASATADAVARFMREARIQGRLDHPAVVPVHELWRDDHGQPFFVMKQLSGTTLADVLGKLSVGDAEAARAYPRQRLLRAFADVCLAIEFAHTRGVIHRDLKPANIMLGDFGEVYVLDWGIARVTGDDARDTLGDGPIGSDGATQAGSVLGTPGYMAPEQLRGVADLDGRADIYALGCILFEILSGEPLHARGQGALTSTLAGADGRPSTRGREIAPELDATCLAATMLDRDDRFATARELGDAVQRFLDGDRDVAMRRELAVTELAAAHAALARGNSAADRRTAIRAAARALALDPHAREPADLVGRLMLEPPSEVPQEVEDALANIDLDALYRSRKLITISAFVFFAFVPLLLLAGFREAWFYVAGSALALAIFAVARLAPRRHTVIASRAILAGWLLIVALFAVITTPMVIAPGLAAVVAMSLATHPIVVRGWVLAVGTIAAVLVPWPLAWLGALDRVATVSGSNLVLHTSAGALDPAVTLGGLAVYIVVMVSMAVLLARSLANDRRIAQRVVQIQAWQLRQLVA